MSEHSELKDNNDVLLDSLISRCTTVSSTPIKCRSPLNNEDGSSKKPKLDIHTEAVSLQNTTEKLTSFTKSKISNVIRRIFPGPAGILSEENITSSQMEVYSQGTPSIFQDDPWKEMSKDFKINNSIYLYDKFNIAWIKKEATANKFAIQKAPFLACILQSLEVSNGQTQQSVNVTLKDRTGTIQGTILLALYEDYASHITVGSILVLVNFGVLTCSCDKCDNHHLTITPKNLTAIYSDKTKIMIKKVEPQTLLTDFYKCKKELELSVRNKTLVKSDIPNRTFFSSTSRHSFNINNRSASYGEATCSSNVQNQSVNLNHSLNSLPKCGSANNIVPKFKKNCTDNAQNEPQNDNNINKSSNNYINVPKKMFSFKKVPWSKVTHSSMLPSQSSNKHIKIKDSGRIKTYQDSWSNAVNSSNVSCEKNINAFPRLQESVDCLSEPKNSFNFHKPLFTDKNDRAPLTRSINYLSCTTSKSHKNGPIMNKNGSIQIPGSQVSLTVDCVEHEKLWEDVLGNMDLNSLFDDDF